MWNWIDTAINSNKANIWELVYCKLIKRGQGSALWLFLLLLNEWYQEYPFDVIANSRAFLSHKKLLSGFLGWFWKTIFLCLVPRICFCFNTFQPRWILRDQRTTNGWWLFLRPLWYKVVRFSVMTYLHAVKLHWKKVGDFPVHQPDITNQTLPDRE
jgi:hypothetical protein